MLFYFLLPGFIIPGIEQRSCNFLKTAGFFHKTFFFTANKSWKLRKPVLRSRNNLFLAPQFRLRLQLQLYSYKYIATTQIEVQFSFSSS